MHFLWCPKTCYRDQSKQNSLMALVFVGVFLQLMVVCAAQRRGNALSTTTSASQSQSIAMNQSDCLTAHALCLSELTCKISFGSLDRHCGSSESTCNASKLPHCLSVLKTLENRSPFRNCHCQLINAATKEERETCEFYRRLVLQHPCSPTAASLPVTTRREEARSTASVGTGVIRRSTTRRGIAAQTTRRVAAKGGAAPARMPVNADGNSRTAAVTSTSTKTTTSTSVSAGNCSNLNVGEIGAGYDDCAVARKNCASDEECDSYLASFKRYCRGKGECTGDVQNCLRAAENLRKRSALFSCRCKNARYRKDIDSTERSERCENVRDRFQSQPCLVQGGFYTEPSSTACITAPRFELDLDLDADAEDNGANANANANANEANATTITTMETEETESDEDCFSVVSRCDSDVVCRTQLAKLISACKFMRVPRTMRSSNEFANEGKKKRKNRGVVARSAERCSTVACQQAAVEFYSTVTDKLAKQAAFCSCDKQQPDFANCVKHVDYFRPPCLFQQSAVADQSAASSSSFTSASVSSPAAPSCFTLINECFESRPGEPQRAARSAPKNTPVDSCQQRWRHFQQECRSVSPSSTNGANAWQKPYDENESRCVRGVASCRTAMIKLIGLPLFTSYCSCDGIGDAKLKNLCESVQHNLFSNECVREAAAPNERRSVAALKDNSNSGAVTASTMPKAAQTGIASLVPDRRQAALPSTLSTGYGGVAQERYPRDFCSQVQRYNRLSNMHRIYMYVNGSECSELCDCSKDGTYACRNLTCETRTDALLEASSTLHARSLCGDRSSSSSSSSSQRSGVVLSDEGQQCVCQNGELVCAPSTTRQQSLVESTTTRAPQNNNNNNNGSGNGTDSAGLFLHVGYSVNERKMLESNQIRIDYESLVRKLTQLLNGETGIRACDLQVQTATDGNIVFEVKITGNGNGKNDPITNTNTNDGVKSSDGRRNEDGTRSSVNATKTAAADLSHQVCYYPAQLLSHFINLRHPAVSHDAELSVFRSAALRTPRYPIRNEHDRLTEANDDDDSVVQVEQDSDEVESELEQEQEMEQPLDTQPDYFDQQFFARRRAAEKNRAYDDLLLARSHSQVRDYQRNSAESLKPIGSPALIICYLLYNYLLA